MAEYEDDTIYWRDRKHVMWFPFSFTIYEVQNDRLYQQTGFFNTKYDELLLYRVMDLTLKQSLAQKIYGTGTIVLKCKADATPEIFLENVKHPREVKEMLSELIEEARAKRRVVGNEFFGHDMNVDEEFDAF